MSLSLQGLQQRLQAFDIRQEVREVIVETSEDVAKFNKAQLYSGIRSTGTEIKPEYKEYTVMVKDLLGQPVDRVTLKDTGAFYDSIKVDVNSETFEISAIDEKSEKLQKKYGKTIFGLTEESRGTYVEYVFFPELRNRIEAKIGLKLE